MTITTDSTETEAPIAPASTFTLPAHVLRDLLVGTLLAASRDETMPRLASVHLAWGDGLLVATATDRYRMHEGRVQCDVGASGEAIVRRQDADALAKLLPKAAKVAALDTEARVSLDGTPHSRTLVVEHDGNVRRLLLIEEEYPKVGSLWPDPDKAGAVSDVAMNPALVADIAKIPLGRKGLTYWRWTLFGEGVSAKPVLAVPVERSAHAHIAWRVVVMPVRLADAP